MNEGWANQYLSVLQDQFLGIYVMTNYGGKA